MHSYSPKYSDLLSIVILTSIENLLPACIYSLQSNDHRTIGIESRGSFFYLTYQYFRLCPETDLRNQVLMQIRGWNQCIDHKCEEQWQKPLQNHRHFRYTLSPRTPIPLCMCVGFFLHLHLHLQKYLMEYLS